MIYLDNNATTRVAPEVFEAMQPYLTESYGNPSSAHTFGRQMREAVENARAHVALLLGVNHADEIVFTSGGSESDNWALGGFLEQTPNQRHNIPTQSFMSTACKQWARFRLTCVTSPSIYLQFRDTSFTRPKELARSTFVAA